MKTGLRNAVVTTLLALVSMSAFALPITYDVNRMVGVAGGVVGSITTNGTVGLLDAADITSWNLTLTTDTGAQVTLFDGNSSWELDGMDFTASMNALIYDFSSAQPEIVRLVSVENEPSWQWNFGTLLPGGLEQVSCSSGFGGECMAGPAGTSSSSVQTLPFMIIGTRMGVPEPATVGLLGLGLAGIVLSRGRKRR